MNKTCSSILVDNTKTHTIIIFLSDAIWTAGTEKTQMCSSIWEWPIQCNLISLPIVVWQIDTDYSQYDHTIRNKLYADSELGQIWLLLLGVAI